MPNLLMHGALYQDHGFVNLSANGLCFGSRAIDDCNLYEGCNAMGPTIDYISNAMRGSFENE